MSCPSKIQNWKWTCQFLCANPIRDKILHISADLSIFLSNRFHVQEDSDNTSQTCRLVCVNSLSICPKYLSSWHTVQICTCKWLSSGTFQVRSVAHLWHWMYQWTELSDRLCNCRDGSVYIPRIHRSLMPIDKILCRLIWILFVVAGPMFAI